MVIAVALSACQTADDPDLVRREASEGSAAGAVESSDRPRVVFMGTSLTAGYGLEDPDDGYTALIRATVDSLGLPLDVVNAGVSGETSAGGLRRIEWLLDRPTRVLLIELGANDGLRGQDPQAMRNNLQAIIDGARERHPDLALVIAGMEAPPNMGADYAEAFRAVFPALATQNDALLIPFLLEGVAGEATLNQEDGIHPNRLGHRRAADNVWQVIEPLLRRVAAESGAQKPAG